MPCYGVVAIYKLFQSTLPYGSDNDEDTMLFHYPISIHAPLRERLSHAPMALPCITISIHAPLRERLCFGWFPSDVRISIHAPLRERLTVYLNSSILLSISIHAPLRERPPAGYYSVGYSNFNPRSLTGANLLNKRNHSRHEFQSTLPYGSDSVSKDGQTYKQISIHAPLRERLVMVIGDLLVIVFQSTLPYGSDQPRKVCRLYGYYFNPRSLTGAIQFNSITFLLKKFQSTLPYGSDT